MILNLGAEGLLKQIWPPSVEVTLKRPCKHKVTFVFTLPANHFAQISSGFLFADFIYVPGCTLNHIGSWENTSMASLAL